MGSIPSLSLERGVGAHVGAPTRVRARARKVKSPECKQRRVVVCIRVTQEGGQHRLDAPAGGVVAAGIAERLHAALAGHWWGFGARPTPL